jgi:hypothetical protein
VPDHVVAQGECITSIADQYGLPWERVWNHPQIAALRQKRKDPNVLYPGDSLFVPDLDLRKELRPTDKRHPFKKKGTPAKLDLCLLEEDKPRAGEPYRLLIDGVMKTGTIDGSGHIRQNLPPGARSGTLYVGSGSTQDVYQLNFGVLDPIDTDEGVAGRLRNLGYGTEDIAEAIRAFQDKEKLPVTGEADDATRARLVSKFGQ